MHYQLPRTVHQKPATKYNHTDDDPPYYKHIPANVLESDKDITLTDKVTDTTYLIDITVPEMRNLQKNVQQKV
jgi:hypothetical protein